MINRNPLEGLHALQDVRMVMHNGVTIREVTNRGQSGQSPSSSEIIMGRAKLIPTLLLIPLLAILASCGTQPPTETATTRPEMGKRFSSPTTNTDGTVRILLYYDMEGISGLNDIAGLSYQAEEYVAARDWLTKDVNAVVDGLFAGGAGAVDVVDAHGSGNPEPDILLDDMDSRARLIYRDGAFRPYVDLTEKGTYDGVAVVCMHSRTGGGGFGAHTYTLEWIGFSMICPLTNRRLSPTAGVVSMCPSYLPRGTTN